MFSTRHALVALSLLVVNPAFGESAPAPAQERSYFVEQCKSPKSDEIARTIKVILAMAGTEDCEKARSAFSNKMDMDISRKDLTDLSPIGEFDRVLELEMSYNKVKDFSFLKGMKKLKRIRIEGGDIGDQQIADMVTYAPQITVVFMGNNNVTDISPLSKLKDLRTLHAAHNKITSFDFTGQRKINVLDLSHNQIESVEGIGDQMRLLEVSFRGNKISDISPLSKHTSIWDLDVNDNKITSIESVGLMNNIIWFQAEGNQIADISPLVKVNSLEAAYLGRNKISALPVFDNKLVRILHLEGNSISDLTPLVGVDTIQTLVLDKNQVANISPLKDLPAVRLFSLKENPLGTSQSKTGDNCPADAKSASIAAWCSAL